MAAKLAAAKGVLDAATAPPEGGCKTVVKPSQSCLVVVVPPCSQRDPEPHEREWVLVLPPPKFSPPSLTLCS
ncbi:hypothetical protein SESBI_33271 [Sesbania bispinosa]|nr:hypothetical protein SESBI_33271 [Sesbania bispinosa]